MAKCANTEGIDRTHDINGRGSTEPGGYIYLPYQAGYVGGLSTGIRYEMVTVER